jgi:hypothetical protein
MAVLITDESRESNRELERVLSAGESRYRYPFSVTETEGWVVAKSIGRHSLLFAVVPA